LTWVPAAEILGRDDRLGTRRHRREHVTGSRFGDRSRPHRKIALEGIDEAGDALLVEITDHDLLDRANSRDGFELGVGLDARTDQPQTARTLNGEMVGGDRRRRSRSLHREFGAVHDRERDGVPGVRIDPRPEHGG
jgi:hypothetical protein